MKTQTSVNANNTTLKTSSEVVSKINEALLAETSFFRLITTAGATASSQLDEKDFNNSVTAVMACYNQALSKFTNSKGAKAYFKNGMLAASLGKAPITVETVEKGEVKEIHTTADKVLKGSKAQLEKAMPAIRDELEVKHGLANTRKTLRGAQNTGKKVEAGNNKSTAVGKTTPTAPIVPAKNATPATQAKVQAQQFELKRDEAIKTIEANTKDAKFMAELKTMLAKQGYNLTKKRTAKK
jgi:hypothetical protein